MTEVVSKELDERGRIIVPKKWREKVLKGRRVLMKLKDGVIEISPLGSLDLTALFDKGRVDVKSDLSDWHAVKRELSALPVRVRRHDSQSRHPT